jgi:alpha-L-fucosidase
LATTYSETWTSVNTHTPAPEWFQDAKFGIYFHWGAFTTPQYGSEWYPRNMYHTTDGVYTHHESTYGDPNNGWGYQNFITGKTNKAGVWTQFAPKLLADGGRIDPAGFARLFDSAGAKYAGPVLEHHDGFSMWDSKANTWNSVSKGPKLNLGKLWVDAFRAKGLKIVVTLHTAWHFNGYYTYVPTQTVDSLKMLFGQMTAAKENQLWYDKMKEVVDEFEPDILWQDSHLYQVTEAMRLKFLAYYYNKEATWGKQVVATYKDGFNTNGEVLDYERGGPSGLTSPYWLADDALSSSSWSYTVGMGYYSSTQMLHRLIDLVSKNGNLLLNVSPMADGSLPTAQRTILLAMGDWLRKFGSSIYGTRAWSVYGEGPTSMGGGNFTAPVAGTYKDIRYTRAKDTSAVYAIFLGWPGNGTKMTCTGLSSSKLKLTSQTKVQLMGATSGTDVTLSYTQDASGMYITFPSSQPYTALAYPVRIQLKNTTTGIDSREVASSSGRLGTTERINGLAKVAVPDGAHWVTVVDPKGRLLEHRNLLADEREYSPKTRAISLVRFDP